ncbi:MAG: hypothetical protein DI551_04040 [Micavibrio aeruginosavorus]|uniref:phosphoglycolate phosphatase n=1 Tax=Micavibrio aeruginosavorus TaxID=349221 RepID=A0A2W5N106_9BACT|nr:MAG: hypothetical protein DI551_04040 [Micavibrio aeruginosavorus]
MSIDLSHIEGVIWDLDGTLYRYDHLFIEACNIACAHTAIELGAKLDFDSALALARKSFEDKGNSSHYFCEYHGIDYRDLHTPYHDRVDISIIAKNAEMIAALEAIDKPMVILTNASRNWVRRILEHTGMDHLFVDQKIVALEDVDFKAKAHHKDGFQMGLSALHKKATQVLMVEDLPRNLPHAKEMGMTTALVHHGKIPDDHAAHIDHSFQTTLELAHALR